MTSLHHILPGLPVHARAYVCLVFLLGVSCCGSACSPYWHNLTEHPKDLPVRFHYADASAHKVCVAGSFNNWSPQTDCLTRTGPDSWLLLIHLPPGRYPYRFIIDDASWRPDPQAVLNEQDGFGGENSILIVE